MRTFVTGATGFVGGQLVDRLLARGDEVVALVRDKQRAADLAEKGVQLVQGDITKRETMREPMRGAEGVYHVAGWYRVGSRDYKTARAVNVVGTRNVLSLMKELDIPKGVYTSTLAVNSDTKGKRVDESYRFDGQHLTVYDQSKWQAHHEVAVPLMREGLPLVTVMPGLIYGPGDTSQAGDAMRDYLRGNLPVLPAKAGVCWTHIEDVVEAHLLAMDRGEVGESYIIAGPCHTFVEAYQLAEEITGIKAPGINVPPWLMRVSAALMAPLEQVLPIPETFRSESLRAQAGVTYWGNNQKARQELGYEPRSLEQGLQDTLPELAREIGVTLPDNPETGAEGG